MKIQENIPLAPYTTLQVGGSASYFAEPADEDEIVEALRWARARGLPLFVLGGGSNLLVSDAGFAGLVLHMTLASIEAHDVDAMRDGRRVYSVGAGVDWDTFVARAVADNCAGVECLSGIPGSVGGAPVQNVGAYGQDVSESITRVCAIDATTLERVEFDRAACGFRYRQSRFNGAELGRYILTRVDYALHPGGAPKIAYAELQRYISDQPDGAATPTLSQTREAVLQIRRAKGMVLDENDADSRSAGSFFKNPVVSFAEYERIAAASSVAVPHFEAGAGQVKLAAAWLIEQAGMSKGFALGPAAISSKHTLALINLGGAKAADILRLKEVVQQRVRQRFAVELHPEPVMLGFGEIG
ncbi:MAG: UDP-N-acetylmuramate dehydrogenase [Candidatus Korobacteraceae bacterium]